MERRDRPSSMKDINRSVGGGVKKKLWSFLLKSKSKIKILICRCHYHYRSYGSGVRPLPTFSGLALGGNLAESALREEQRRLVSLAAALFLGYSLPIFCILSILLLLHPDLSINIYSAASPYFCATCRLKKKYKCERIRLLHISFETQFQATSPRA